MTFQEWAIIKNIIVSELENLAEVDEVSISKTEVEELYFNIRARVEGNVVINEGN